MFYGNRPANVTKGCCCSNHRNRDLKSHMRRLALIFTLMSFLVLGLNVFVDPASLLSAEYDEDVTSDEQKIAELISKGHNVVVPKRKLVLTRGDPKFFDGDRATKYSKFNFWELKGKYLTQRLFKESPHFVDAVNAATLEDLLVFTFFLRKLIAPKKVYISRSTVMIAKSNDYADWLKVSVPDHFVSAVYFDFTLPTKVNGVFGLVCK